MSYSVVAEEKPLRSYRMAMGWRIFLSVAGVLLVGLFVWVGVLPFTEGTSYSLFAMIFFPFLAISMISVFVLGLIEAHKSVLLVYPDRIKIREIFRTREFKIADIEGFRVIPNQFTLLFPKNKDHKKVKISTTYEKFKELSAWIAGTFIDLDAAEAAVEQKAILGDREFGNTDRERTEALDKARTLTKYLNGFGLAIGLWAFIFPRPYEALLVVCALLPMIGVLALVRSKGLIRFDERRNSAYPSIARMFMMPSLALAGRSFFDFDILDLKMIAAPITLGTAILSFVILSRTKEFQGKAAVKLLVVGFVAVYCYGLTIMGNCLFDTSEPTIYTVQVLNKHSVSGKTTTYYIKLAPWGPVAEPEDVSVPRSQYTAVRIGNTVVVNKKQGLLQIPWFYISLYEN